MTIQGILNTISHRPWNLPALSWSYYQEWNDVVFMHWPVDLEELKKFVPNELEIDTFDGTSWVSVVAFDMENVRLRYLPAFAPVSNFHELNVRTYIRHKGKTGVYFLSIEGSKWLSCFIAKGLSEIPYRCSEMTRNEMMFSSLNTKLGNQLNLEYEIGASIQTKTNLDKWLTERYALAQDVENEMLGFDIHHAEWPLRHVNIQMLEIQYPCFGTLISGMPPLAHYSKGVQVLAWEKVRTSQLN